MRRRALLSTLGTLAVAGCASRDREAGGETTATTAVTTATTSGPTTSTTTGEPTPEPPDSVESAWPVPGADAGRTGFVPAADGPTSAVAELWSVSTGTRLTGPVLADGTLYLGGEDGRVRALDARTGTERWRVSAGDQAGTPHVRGDAVYVPTDDGVVRLAASDGARVWRADAPSRRDLLVASGDVYYVASGEEPAVVSLDADGTEQWRTTLADPWSPPLFASDDHLFVSTGANAPRPWVFDAETGDRVVSRPEPGHDFPAEQLVTDGTVLAADAFFGNVEAGSVSGGEYDTRWNDGVPAAVGFALTAGAESVFFQGRNGDRPGLYALSLTDGSERWHVGDVPALAARPVAASETLLVHTGDRLRAFDPVDGSEQWSRAADGVGEQFVVGDDLLFAVQEGTVRAFRPP